MKMLANKTSPFVRKARIVALVKNQRIFFLLR